MAAKVVGSIVEGNNSELEMSEREENENIFSSEHSDYTPTTDESSEEGKGYFIFLW